MINFYWIVIVLLVFQLAGCGISRGIPDGPPNFYIDVAKIPDAVPRAEPPSKFANPQSYIARGKRYYIMKSAKGYCQRGTASWYGMKFHKVRTSSGEPYNVAAMTAAHRTLPIPTYVQVTNLKNGKHVIVKVNDRGPFIGNRLIDLSYVAAVKLGVTTHGTAEVEVKAVDPRHYRPLSSLPQVKKQPAVALTQIKLPHRANHPAFYLQIGMFVQRHNAEELAECVKKKTSYPVLIRINKQSGQTIYRLHIGPVPNKATSEQLGQKLRESGLGKSIILKT
jgi:rare lipoprotein A